jgi:hypothetical protein
MHSYAAFMHTAQISAGMNSSATCMCSYAVGMYFIQLCNRHVLCSYAAGIYSYAAGTDSHAAGMNSYAAGMYRYVAFMYSYAAFMHTAQLCSINAH